MKTNQVNDVIIIGAGPAGLMAARELENRNINYRIIDTKKNVGHPLRCGELTRAETFYDLFPRNSHSLTKNEISKVSFCIKDIQTIVRKKLFMIDKAQFLQWLAQPTAKSLQLETLVSEITKEEKRWILHTNKGTFSSKLLILANGTNFKTQKKYGLLTKKVEMVPCIGGIFHNVNLKRDTAYLFFDEKKYIASWAFPKSDCTCNAGAGLVLKKRKTIRMNLKAAIKQSMTKLNIPLEGEFSFGGSYVTNGPIHRTYSDRLLVCGDAAGQTFAVFGEGIYFSLIAGQIAGQTAAKAVKSDRYDEGILMEYESDWKKTFGPQMDAGIAFATVMFFLMKNHLTRYALKTLKEDEIFDIWFKGRISLRLKLFCYLLKIAGQVPKR